MQQHNILLSKIFLSFYESILKNILGLKIKKLLKTRVYVFNFL